VPLVVLAFPPVWSRFISFRFVSYHPASSGIVQEAHTEPFHPTTYILSLPLPGPLRLRLPPLGTRTRIGLPSDQPLELTPHGTSRLRYTIEIDIVLGCGICGTCGIEAAVLAPCSMRSRIISTSPCEESEDAQRGSGVVPYFSWAAALKPCSMRSCRRGARST